LPGRRRLCKTHESGPQENNEKKEENISDILDEFSFRLESLSLHKKKPSMDEGRGETSMVEEAYFSSKEGEEEGEFDDNFDEDNFKIVPRNMKHCYFSDEDSEMVNEGEEIAKKKILVAEYFNDEVEIVEVEDFTKPEVENGTKENNFTRCGNQGSVIKPSAYRSMGRTTKKSYFSDDDEVEEINEITTITGLQVNELDLKEEDEVHKKEESDFTLQGVQEGKGRVYKMPNPIFVKLYPHQRDGISWLWRLHCKGTGGILGDDMGLGKTMQVYPTSLVCLF
jgi:DNA excision repair protein ERCC-6-like